MLILLCGGAGYIGSHTALELLEQGYDVIIADINANTRNSLVLKEKYGNKLKIYNIDCANHDELETVFSENKIDAVINFAGYKSISESIAYPLNYYRNNLGIIITVLDVMKQYGCKKLIFSSSATVYGNPETIPITEDCKTGGTTNPYGSTKLFIEQILKDVYASDNTMNICILRYFNPVGAHPSGLLEPDITSPNLMSVILKTAMGINPELSIYGCDYNTLDGTCIRDYIHVVDLAKGHIQALKKAPKGLSIYNLGTGIGYSVLDMISAFESTTGQKIKKSISDRRPGDVAICYADTQKALNELDWKAEKTLKDMCKDSWNSIK